MAACREAGVQYMDGTMWLHNPRTRYMKDILNNSNLMGSLKTVTASYNWLGAGWAKNTIMLSGPWEFCVR